MKRDKSLMVYLDKRSYTNIRQWSIESDYSLSGYIALVVKLWEAEIAAGTKDPVIDNNFHYKLVACDKQPEGNSFKFE